MSKPIGAYGVQRAADTAPLWLTWSRLTEYEPDRLIRFTSAAALSLARPGFRWVLTLGNLPVADHVGQVLADLHASGLWPHIFGIEFGEEVISNADAGAYPHLGHQGPTERRQRLEAAWTWVQGIYADIDAWYPRRWRRIWVEHVYNDDRRYGLDYWRPCPAEVDILQLSTYNADILPYALDHAVRTQTRPIIITPKWFSDPNHTAPDAASVALYGRLLAHPRVMGACGYAWEVSLAHRQDGARALSEWPEWHDPIRRACGV